MPKSQVCVSIDTSIIEEAKQNNIVISQFVEESLRTKLAILKRDVSDIDLKLLENNYELESNKLMKLQIKVTQLKETIDKIKSGQYKKEQEELQKQKEEILKQKTCCVCGNLIDGTKKNHRTKVEGSFMCGNCYLDLDGETSRKWF